MATRPVSCPVTQGYRANCSYYAKFNLKLRDGSSCHEGIDYGCKCGTEVKAAHAGTVRYAGNLGNYGNYIGIQASDGSGTGYAHLYTIAVKVGQQVAEGQVIGTVGSTGNSTGCHLHFNYYRQYGVWVYDNPDELFAKGENLPYSQDYVDQVVKNWQTAANTLQRFLAAETFTSGGLPIPSDLSKYHDKSPDDIVKGIRALPGYSKVRPDAQKRLDEIIKLIEG